MKAFKVALAISVVLIVALAFLLFQEKQRAIRAEAELQAARAANDETNRTKAESQSMAIPKDEYDRLEAVQREAIKLRGEVVSLKNAVKSAEAKVAAEKANRAAAGSETPTPAEAAPNPYTRVFNTKSMAVLPPDHAIVMGGWEANPGKRMYAFVVPTVDPANPGAVTVATKWVEVTDEASSKIGQNLLAGVAGTQSILTPGQYADAVKSLEDTTGVDILSAPKVTTTSGRAAAITVTQRRNTPDGAAADFGPTMNLVSTINPADGSITVAADATMTLPSEDLQKEIDADIARQNAENARKAEK